MTGSAVEADDDGLTGSEIGQVFREVYGKAVATLVRVFGDITLAEDAVQDAFVVATETWPRHGIPANPAGWIVTTSRRRAIDAARRRTRGRELEQVAVAGAGVDDPVEADCGEGAEEVAVEDDRLRLMFTCCHPSLRSEHQVALTLRLMGGLTMKEIADSFLVGESAMARRIGRAKYKITAANIPYRVPAADDLPARLRPVLAVVYLIYNAGANELEERASLRTEALRLARTLAELVPEEPEAAGLLALLLLNESRVPSRTGDGSVVLLRDQDRRTWDEAKIAEGHQLVRWCIERNRPGPYQLQASIQAVHCHAPTFEETDWAQIVELYDHLMTFMPTPVVALNRAVALGEAQGAAAALAALDEIGGDLAGYHLLHAARATALRQLDRDDEARAAFERALALATSESDRRHFSEQIAEL